MSPGLMIEKTGSSAKKAYFTNGIVSLKQHLSGLKATN